MKILVTCFEPFGDCTLNSSMECCRLLSTRIGSKEVVKQILPVSFARAPQKAAEAILKINPDAVICTGQAPRDKVCLERVALNLIHTSRPDNDGVCPKHQRIATDQPDGIFTNVDVDMLQEKLARACDTTRISNSAGLYVCNALYFHLLAHFPNLPVLFVHIPETVTYYEEENRSGTITSKQVVNILTEIIKFK